MKYHALTGAVLAASVILVCWFPFSYLARVILTVSSGIVLALELAVVFARR